MSRQLRRSLRPDGGEKPARVRTTRANADRARRDAALRAGLVARGTRLVVHRSARAAPSIDSARRARVAVFGIPRRVPGLGYLPRADRLARGAERTELALELSARARDPVPNSACAPH